MRYFSPIEYIKIDISNQFGLDKAIWDTRLQWVDDRVNDLEHFIEDADKKILFAKSVRAYRQAEKGEAVNMAVSLDK